MARARRSPRHKDLEFEVTSQGRPVGNFRSFDEASAAAISVSASTGRSAQIDVLTWSRAAAKAWQGEYGVQVYDEDPEASVHDRIEVRAEARGRVA